MGYLPSRQPALSLGAVLAGRRSVQGCHCYETRASRVLHPIAFGSLRRFMWILMALWFGCGTGLCRDEHDRVSVLGMGSGIPEDVWNGIVADKSGNLWIRSSTRLLTKGRLDKRFVAVQGVPESSTWAAYICNETAHCCSEPTPEYRDSPR